jgi:hypothetical protein
MGSVIPRRRPDWRSLTSNAVVEAVALDETRAAERVRARNETSTSFQMAAEFSFQMRALVARRTKSFCRKFSILRLAGAPGFEPGNGGIKIRCLTTWLRPNRPERPNRPAKRRDHSA